MQAPVRALAIAILLAVVIPAGAALAKAAPFPAVRGNPADRLARLPIDDERYDHATRCRRHPMRGTRALEGWLARHAGGGSWGILRCERLGPERFSLHAEGRALDWHLDAADRAQRREAERIIALLLAPDRAGNPRALARRMGVQEIIFDCRAWFSGSDRMRPYSACYDRRGRRRRGVDRTLAHRDHIHLGLTRAGARMRTSFWSLWRSARRG